jgi:hypothetical protein
MPVIAATHTPVNSGRPRNHRFGQGIAIPYKGRQMPYTQADLDEAVRMFAGSPEPDWDAMALEAEYQARLDAMAPSQYGRCLLCSTLCDDLTFQGLCDRCDDDATNDSTACRNQFAGLGRQVF